MSGRDCPQCGGHIAPNDPAAETTAGIVCRDCAKRGGVDVGAFCHPLHTLADDVAEDHSQYDETGGTPAPGF